MREQRPAFRTRLLRLLGLGLLGAAAVKGAHADAQDLIAAQIAPGADVTKGKESTENVFVRSSAIAEDKFRLAQRMEELKEWNKSADLYQEVLEKYHDRVIADGVDAQGVINRYTSVSKGVLAQLRKWPQEGLDIYRSRYEASAAALVQNARPDDLFALHKAFDLYFVTESGKAAGLRLIDANLEHGEFAAAAWLGDQLLDMHPNLVAERPAVLFRTALAYYLAGDKEKATQRESKLAANFPKEVGVVRGKDVTWIDALRAEMKQAPTIAVAGASDSWPMMGGDPARSAVSTAKAKAGTRLVTIPLAKPEFRNITPQQKILVQQQFDIAGQTGQTLGIMPVTDRGELYFQDGQRVYAVNLESGVPLSGWMQTWGADRHGQYMLPGVNGSARSYQQTLTLTDRAVLAVMGQQDRQLMMTVGMAVQGEPRLVCLDRATGKENWVVALSSASDIPHNDDEKTIRALQFSGSPLVVGDNVLVIGRSNKPTQGEDCYVLAFDLGSGKFRWACYIASSGMGANLLFGMAGGNDNTSHLAYSNGRVYVLSNVGALAALDAYSGTVVWLNIYPVDHPAVTWSGRGFNPMFVPSNGSAQSRLKPWNFNPVVIRDGRIFMLPTDGSYLVIYDAGSGQEIKRISLDQLARWNLRSSGSEQPDKPTTLIGVNGDRILLCGESRLLCLDWKKYTEASFPGPDDRMIIWPKKMATQLRGRPFMTADWVFIPAEDRLYQADMRNGSSKEVYPQFSQTWEADEAPGNVLVTTDHVVMAGATSVNVYTDLAVAVAKLDRELAAAPADPQPRLRYAEVMFAAGKFDEAITRLDESVALVGGPGAMAAGTARDRVFNDALTFAQKLMGDEGPSARARAGKLFERAATAAASPQQQVHYRVSRAKFAEASKDAAMAVKLYQQILADAAMRVVPLLDESAGTPTQADDVAEKSIDALIHSAGQGVYEPYQQQAAREMAAAQAEKDPMQTAEKLLAVAQTYPNSTVAPESMLAASQAYESASEPRTAIRVLRQMWFKHPQGPSRAQVLEGLARNYLSLRDRNRAELITIAAARLALGSTLPGDPKLAHPLKLPDDKVIAEGTTFSAALEELRRLESREVSRTLPDFHLPIPPTSAQRAQGMKTPKPFIAPGPDSVVPGAAALVMPARDFARADRVITWSAAGLSIFAPMELKPIARSSSFAGDASNAPRGVAWAGDSALVWGKTQLVAIDGASGKSGWTLDLSKVQMIEVVRASDAPPPVALDPNAAMINMQVPNGPIFGRRGVILPQQRQAAFVQPAAQPADAAAQQAAAALAAGEQIAEVRPVGDRVLVSTTSGRLLSLELSSGHIAWQTRLGDHAPDRLVATEDFTVVKISDELTVRLFALDTFSGRILGSKPFYTQQGPGPVNLALAPDGTLVYTMPDRLCLKDLYKNWKDDEKVDVAQPGQPIYAGASQPGQLLIAEGRILLVADNAPLSMMPNEKYVRVHSLETGHPLSLKYVDGDGKTKKEIDRVLTAGTKEWRVMMRLIGPHLYVIGPRTVLGYNLDKPEETWKGSTDSLTASAVTDVNFGDAFIGQNHLVVLDQPVNPQGQPSGKVRLHAFARYKIPGGKTDRESGKLDYSFIVSEPGVTATWQACDGGFYYVSADSKVHMLRGAVQ